jgi:hypothetical protein
VLSRQNFNCSESCFLFYARTIQLNCWQRHCSEQSDVCTHVYIVLLAWYSCMLYMHANFRHGQHLAFMQRYSAPQDTASQKPAAAATMNMPTRRLLPKLVRCLGFGSCFPALKMLKRVESYVCRYLFDHTRPSKNARSTFVRYEW